MNYFEKTLKFDLKKSLHETFQLFYMDCDFTLAIRFWYGYTASIFVGPKIGLYRVKFDAKVIVSVGVHD